MSALPSAIHLSNLSHTAAADPCPAPRQSRDALATWARSRRGLATLVGLLSLLLSWSAIAAPEQRYTPGDLIERAGTIDGTFRLDGLRRSGDGSTWLSLTPQPIFTDGAVLVVVGDDGEQTLAPPAVRHFHGHERDDPAALAFVSVHPDGTVRGWLRRSGQVEAVHREPGSSSQTLSLARVELQDASDGGRQFSCGSDALPSGGLIRPEAAPAPWYPRAPGSVTAAAAGQRAHAQHWVSVAIDSDFQYYTRFNNTNAAAAYAADLIGYSSLIYRNELHTGLLIPYLRLFTTASQPWQQSGSTACMLFEFGQHWHQHQGQVQRTIAHFLSGKNLQGGVAWLGVLCNANQQTNISSSNCPGLPAVGHYHGGYGVSTSLLGNFNPGNPQSVWDIVVVAHEIGHNFNSPHTHCYGGIGGNPATIDQCHVEQVPGLQCHSGPTSLPGPVGQGSGTMMSYCHLLQGNLSNIALSLGTGHPYGVQPVRVPNRMATHVQERAAQVPACFEAPGIIFAHGFECSTGAPGCGGGGAVCLSSNGATANGGWFSGDPNNRVRNLNIGAGNQLTGLAIDVRVQAIAPSWLDEARLMFSSTNPNAHAVQYTPGLGMEQPGTINHSSNGVFSFAGAGIQHVVAGADGILRVEWFETFNDPEVNPDSLWSNHPSPTVCPGIRLICSNQAACDAAAQAAP